MKKNILLGTLLSLYLSSGYSQSFITKLSVEALGGISFPVGSFSSGSTNGLYVVSLPKASGMADIGPAYEVKFKYQLKRAFGISFSLAGQQNKVNQTKFRENMIENLQYLSGGGASSSDKFMITTKAWNIFRAMAGFYYEIPMHNNKFHIHPNVSIGVLKTSIPAYSFIDITTFGYSGTVYKTSLPLSFCYGLGTGLQWDISKKIYLSGNLDFYHSNSKETSIKGVFGANSQNSKIPISSINTLFGIGYKF